LWLAELRFYFAVPDFEIEERRPVKASAGGKNEASGRER
jgi:hypothetical protein